MIYANIVDNKIIDVVRVDPYSVFSESYAAQFIEVPDEVTTLYTFDGINFIPPTIQEPIDVTPVQPTKEELLMQLEQLTKQIQALE